MTLRGLGISLGTLSAHRLRTALSVSALVIGVAAVTVMAAVGQGAQRQVAEQLRSLGTDLVVVSASPAPRMAGRERQEPFQTNLRSADAEAILEGSRYARRAAAAVSRTETAHHEGISTATGVTGIRPEGLVLRNVAIAIGRAYDDVEDLERRRVAVLGHTVAQVLFGESDPVGMQIRIGRVPFDVIGVARARGTDASGADQDHVIFVPLETALRRLFNIPYVHHLYIQATSTAALPALEQDVRAILEDRHPARPGQPETFRILNQALLLESERESARSLSRLTLGVAALALAVGGIGILAVMLLSVRERIPEIGLRRALGATRRDIHAQFVLESAILAAAGGGIGVLTGALAAVLAAWAGDWPVALSVRAAAAGLVACLMAGAAAGILPARHAARLEPVEALRVR